MRPAADPSSLDVCFVLPSLSVGGAERVVVNLANGLLAAGHAPRLLLTDRGGPLGAELDAAVPVTSLGRSRVRQALPALARELRRDAPDVIVSTHTHVNLALAAARRLLPAGARLVLREPIHVPSPLDGAGQASRRLQRILYRRSDLLIVTSQAMHADLTPLTGASTLLLPNPVDEERVRHLGQAHLRSVERPRGRLLIAVGRLVAQKAYPDLLRRFAAVATEDDRLIIFGQGADLASIEQISVSLGLERQVRFAGASPTVFAHVAAADAFVLASTHEGMPNAALEALALGTPIIATTDLNVLTQLAAISPPGAVTLVPRVDLEQALAATRRRSDATGSEIRPSLLPREYVSRAVVDRFVEALQSLFIRTRER